MARPLRLEVPNGIYHVTARGNARGRIYHDDIDRQAFLCAFDKTLARHAWKCLAYCLMGNHFHLVVRTPHANLSRGMHHLNCVYAQKFNRRRKRCGHVFQGRFKAVLVERDDYLLEVVRYVVRNPVKAKLCASPDDWPWSSHRALLGIEPPGFVSANEVLALFDHLPSRARPRYRTFVEMDTQTSTPVPEDQVILGSDQFREQHLPATTSSSEHPEIQLRPPRPAIGELLAGAKTDQAIALAYRQHGFLLREIGDALGCHYSTVSRRLKVWEMQENARGKT